MREPTTTRTGRCRLRSARTGMTIIELTIALGILAVTVGGLIELQVSMNTSQEELWNRQEALRGSQNIADAVIREPGDWAALCAEYDAMPGVDVTVQDGDGDPGSGWARITVRVRMPADAGPAAEEATLVFGRKK